MARGPSEPRVTGAFGKLRSNEGSRRNTLETSKESSMDKDKNLDIDKLKQTM